MPRPVSFMLDSASTMSSLQTKNIEAVWRQLSIPVVYRPPDKGEILLKLPFSKNNYEWIKSNNQRKPKWLNQFKCWQLPRSWFNKVVEDTLTKHKKLYIIQPYREQEKCAPACWNAEGHECQCSCMGANHGAGNSDGHWFIVSDTFATTWRQRELACRLLEVKP